MAGYNRDESRHSDRYAPDDSREIRRQSREEIATDDSRYERSERQYERGMELGREYD